MRSKYLGFPGAYNWLGTELGFAPRSLILEPMLSSHFIITGLHETSITMSIFMDKDILIHIRKLVQDHKLIKGGGPVFESWSDS